MTDQPKQEFDEVTERPAETIVEAPVFVRFDSSLEKELRGWAASPDPQRAGDELVLSLTLGSVLLGTLRRDRGRPDVDKYLGHSTQTPGFGIRHHELFAFARMTGLPDPAVVTGGRGVVEEQHRIPEDAVELSTDPLSSRAGIAGGMLLADCTFESRRHLNMRFEGTAQDDMLVTLFQPAPGPSPVLVRLDSTRIGGSISEAAIALLNPYLPVLIVFTALDGSIEKIDILPFPSLIRGGSHHAERMIMAPGADELAAVSSYSASLLEAFAARSRDGGNHVSAIAIDSAATTGLEPIFDADLLLYLRAALAVSVQFGWPGEPLDPPPFIAERLAPFGVSDTTAGHRLLLPAAGIPTLSALLRAGPPGGSGRRLAGSIGLVHWQRHGPVHSVWQPALDGLIDDVQPCGSRRVLPVLAMEGAQPESGWDPAPPPYPLALVSKEHPTQARRESPYEIALELGAPLLRGATQPDQASLSVVVLATADARSPLPLLESLARQQGDQAIEVVVARPAGQKDPGLGKALEALFPGRHRMVETVRGAGRLEQLISLRDSLSNEQVLICDRSVTMPDPRTILTLQALLAVEGVETASCLVRSSGSPAGSLGAGYTLSGLSLATAPALSFDSIRADLFDVPATYPVVAGMPGALLMRRATLAELDGSGAVRGRSDLDALLIGLQVLARGGLNLCTTAVSVYSSEAPAARGQLPVSFPYRLSLGMLDRLQSSAIIVQAAQ